MRRRTEQGQQEQQQQQQKLHPPKYAARSIDPNAHWVSASLALFLFPLMVPVVLLFFRNFASIRSGTLFGGGVGLAIFSALLVFDRLLRFNIFKSDALVVLVCVGIALGMFLALTGYQQGCCPPPPSSSSVATVDEPENDDDEEQQQQQPSSDLRTAAAVLASLLVVVVGGIVTCTLAVHKLQSVH